MREKLSRRNSIKLAAAGIAGIFGTLIGLDRFAHALSASENNSQIWVESTPLIPDSELLQKFKKAEEVGVPWPYVTARLVVDKGDITNTQIKDVYSRELLLRMLPEQESAAGISLNAGYDDKVTGNTEILKEDAGFKIYCKDGKTTGVNLDVNILDHLQQVTGQNPGDDISLLVVAEAATKHVKKNNTSADQLPENIARSMDIEIKPYKVEPPKDKEMPMNNTYSTSYTNSVAKGFGTKSRYYVRQVHGKTEYYFEMNLFSTRRLIFT